MKDEKEYWKAKYLATNDAYEELKSFIRHTIIGNTDAMLKSRDNLLKDALNKIEEKHAEDVGCKDCPNFPLDCDGSNSQFLNCGKLKK